MLSCKLSLLLTSRTRFEFSNLNVISTHLYPFFLKLILRLEHNKKLFLKLTPYITIEIYIPWIEFPADTVGLHDFHRAKEMKLKQRLPFLIHS